MKLFYIIFFCQNTVFTQFVGIKSKNLDKYRKQNLDSENFTHTGGAIDYIIPPLWENITLGESNFEQKTGPLEIIVELLITVDEALHEKVSRWYTNGIWTKFNQHTGRQNVDPWEETILYVRKFITAVNFRYQNFPSMNIKLHISDILLEQDTSFMVRSAINADKFDASATLENMREVFGKKPVVFDVGIFITGEEDKLCSKDCQDIDGLSFMNGVCFYDEPNKPWGLVIVQDLGTFSGVHAAAHEMGHLFGSYHDGITVMDGPIKVYTCDSDDGYIMADLMSAERAKRQNIYKWSSCSAKSIGCLVRSLQGRACLYDKPNKTPYPLMKWEDLIAPNVPTLTDQCLSKSFFQNIYLDRYQITCGDNPCQVLECAVEEKCTSSPPAMEGSRCERGNICFHGECIFKDSVARRFWAEGQCISKKNTPKTEVKELDAMQTKWDCLDSCRALAYPITACEWELKDGRCFAYTEEVYCNHSNGDSSYRCYTFKTCGSSGGTTITTKQSTTSTSTLTSTSTSTSTTTSISSPNKLIDCPSGWRTYKKHCFKVFVEQKSAELNFAGSRKKCLNLINEVNADVVNIYNSKIRKRVDVWIRGFKVGKSMRAYEAFYINRPYDLLSNKGSLNYIDPQKGKGIEYAGKCMGDHGIWQKDGRVDFGEQKDKYQCWYSCWRWAGALGCEYDEKNKRCIAFFTDVIQGDGHAGHACYVWVKGTFFAPQLAESNFEKGKIYEINDTENVCLVAIYDSQTSISWWKYILCSQPVDNVVCMFKQRKSDATCQVTDGGVQDPATEKGELECKAFERLQVFCRSTADNAYCSMRRQLGSYSEAQCVTACTSYTRKSPDEQCLYFIYQKERMECSLMVVCQKLSRLDICTDTTEAKFLSGQCYYTNYEGSGSTSIPVESKHFIVKSDVYNKCSWIDQPEGAWNIGVCKGPGNTRILKGWTVLGKFSNQHNCLESCNSKSDVTGCEYNKSTTECKAHTEPLHPSFGFGTTVCFIYEKSVI